MNIGDTVAILFWHPHVIQALNPDSTIPEESHEGIIIGGPYDETYADHPMKVGYVKVQPSGVFLKLPVDSLVECSPCTECTCKVTTLLNYGCKCGWIEKERNGLRTQ